MQTEERRGWSSAFSQLGSWDWHLFLQLAVRHPPPHAQDRQDIRVPWIWAGPQPRIMVSGKSLVKQRTVLLPGGSWSQRWELRLGNECRQELEMRRGATRGCAGRKRHVPDSMLPTLHFGVFS